MIPIKDRNQSISFSGFLTVFSQTLTSVLFLSFFICCTFVVNFPLFWVLMSFTSMFYSFNHHLFLIFAPNFRHSWLGTFNIFRSTPQLIAFLNESYDSLLYFNKHFFCWNHVAFQLVMFNCSEAIQLRQVFVLGMQITRF